MPLPAPRIGLVVQYAFVWSGAGRRSPPDSGKSRPCLIVDVEDGEEVAGRTATRVTYLPISHVAPREGEHAIEIPARVAQHLKLTDEKSYLYTSYANEDDWPYDLDRVPGESDRYHYEAIPPRLFEKVAADFAAYLKEHPRAVHQKV
jgi:hypothetical protein